MVEEVVARCPDCGHAVYGLDSRSLGASTMCEKCGRMFVVDKRPPRQPQSPVDKTEDTPLFCWIWGGLVMILTLPIFLLEELFGDKKHKLSDAAGDGLNWILCTVLTAVIIAPFAFAGAFCVAIYAVLWAVGGISFAALIILVPLWLFGDK